MTVSVVDEALRALDRVRQQLAQERAVKEELLAALKAANDELVLWSGSDLRLQIDAALQSAEGRRP